MQIGHEGTFQGSSGTIIKTYNYGDTVDVQNVQSIGEFNFDYWLNLDTLEQIRQPFKIVKDTKLKAVYTAPLIIRTEYTGPSTLNLYMQQNDAYSHYYKVLQSKDGINWYNAALSQDAENQIPNIDLSETDKAYNVGSYTYTTKIAGDYKISLYGASGGNSYTEFGTAYGGKGAYTEGTVHLDKDVTLYINIGGAGQNGEGEAWLGIGGGGGNESDVRIHNTAVASRIMVAAAGGGGASYKINESPDRKINGTDGGALTSAGVSSAMAENGTSRTAPTGAGQTSGGKEYYSNPGYGSNCYSNRIGTQTRAVYLDNPSSGDAWGGMYSNSAGGGGYYYGIGGVLRSSVTAGSGGSSYITGYPGCTQSNGVVFKDPVMTAGVRSGDGYGTIKLDIDLQIENQEYMNTIYFYDKAAPNKVTNGKYEYSSSSIKLSWDTPKDNGSRYYHKVESYNSNTNQLIHTSNILDDYLESGLKGYHYYIDTNPSGTVSKSNEFIEINEITIGISDSTRYIHIASIDNAENLGETYTFEIPAKIKVNYDRNNESSNKYGDTVSTTATGNIGVGEIIGGQENRIKYNRTADGDTAYTKEGYRFTGRWNTSQDGTGESFAEGQVVDYNELISQYGTEMTLYAQWEPIRYNIEYLGNGNWNTGQGSYKQEQIRFDQEVELMGCKFSRADGENTEGILGGYQFIGWGTNGSKSECDYVDRQKVKNLRSTEGVYKLYALWKKTITLEFNLTGGTYKSKADTIKLEADIYNSQKEYTFNITGGTTVDSLPNYSAQRNTVDAYGTVIENGLNTLYKKSSERFCGWSLTNSSGRGEPDWEFSTYNPNRKTEYTIHDNATIYAVWEPILSIDRFSLDRVLGNKQFKDGSKPKTSSSNITATTPLTESIVSNILKPGEQGRYNITTHNNGLEVEVIFDSRITDIYKNDSLKDSLNPSTAEDLEAEQLSGLNRHFLTEDGVVSRTFYIPTYQSESGVAEYDSLMRVHQNSYYWSKVHGQQEEIFIPMKIFITDEPSGGSSNTSVLDELRAQLKIRVQ